jgi:DNA-binding HxlR family transcriptional regulator
MSAYDRQFSPVAMAAEVLESRWTLLIVRELCLGSKHFNDIRKGVPKMSPTLLSKRLKELEWHGILKRVESPMSSRKSMYVLTPAGSELFDVINAISNWGKRWIDMRHNLDSAKENLLIWDIRRNLRMEHFPINTAVLQINITDVPKKTSNWWFIFDGKERPDVGYLDPSLDVDLYIETSLSSLTKVWLGESKYLNESKAGTFQIEGSQKLIETFESWFGSSNFASIPKFSIAS